MKNKNGDCNGGRKAFFNFEDNNSKVLFKISLISILDCFNFLIQKGLVEDFSETVKSGIQEKYGKHKSFCNYQYEEINTYAVTQKDFDIARC